jgi:hypothetical protein
MCLSHRGELAQVEKLKYELESKSICLLAVHSKCENPVFVNRAAHQRRLSDLRCIRHIAACFLTYSRASPILVFDGIHVKDPRNWRWSYRVSIVRFWQPLGHCIDLHCTCSRRPTPTFSTCFGQPFIVLHPSKYATMLAERMDKVQAKCWLINTGWVRGFTLS